MSLQAATANGAVAEAMRQIEPHVVTAYPITPQTEVVEEFAKYAADGRLRTVFVPVESEHSSMSACVGAAAAGARVMTATSSQGLAYMAEVLPIASGNRLPIVMVVVNRALSAPINIHCDHSDSMFVRDSGWIQLYCRDAQEAYDTMLQAPSIAEHEDVRLPVMVCYDGFIVSHCLTGLEMLADDEAAAMIGPFKAVNQLLDPDNPVCYGPLVLYDYFMEFRRQQAVAMDRALEVIAGAGRRYGDKTGRPYGLLHAYRMEDARVALVALSSTALTAEVAVDDLRREGVAAGVIAPRSFRPFPVAALNEALGGVEVVGVLDRALSPGAGLGPLAIETAALKSVGGARLYSRVYGLGGRDIALEDIEDFLRKLEDVRRGVGEAPSFDFLGVRE